MKTTNLDHHTEQMEAARASFTELWQDKLRRRALSLNATASAQELAWVQDIAWQSFLHALKIKNGQ